MCALDGYLYAFGGWVGEDIGGTIERYNPTKDQWEYLTKMQEPRFSMGICVYDSLIYLVGGCTHSRRHMQELVSYNPVNLLFFIYHFLSSLSACRTSGASKNRDYHDKMGTIDLCNFGVTWGILGFLTKFYDEIFDL